MMSTPSNSIRRLAFRILATTFLLFVSGSSLAQTKGNYCEPSLPVKEDLRNLDKLDEDGLPYKLRHDRQKALLLELLKKYPNDLFVRRRYQNERSSGFFFDRDAVVADYRAQLEKNPDDPAATYLYARLLVGRQTKEAIELFEKLLLRVPDFPWSYLELAQIHNYPSFHDAAKLQGNLKNWFAKCPAATAGLYLVSRTGDKEMMNAAMQRLRRRLESSNTSDDLVFWDDLWALSFKLRPVPEHQQLRLEIAEDVKRIRDKNLNSKEWLLALQSGYKQTGDKTNRRWAEDEFIRLFPKSDTARSMIQTRWYDDHPYPKAEEPDEKKQAHNQARVQITTEWLKQWPNDENIWSTRLYALIELTTSTDSEIEAAYQGYAKAHEQGGNSYSYPPIEVSVARFFLQHGFHLESIPAMLQKSFEEFRSIQERSRGSDLRPQNDETIDGDLRYVHWQIWPLLAEAHARLKQADKAHEVLAQMAEALKQQKPTEQQKVMYANYQTAYWQSVATVAEFEQRKLDALMAYQTALAFRPKSAAPKSGRKDELTEKAQRVWKEMGGTEQGWQAYLARNETSRSKPEAAETATWDPKNTLLPDFELTDLKGHYWKLADLRGKVALINLWATWCGPCRAELPYVQKLSEQMKENKDVLVLTLNIDDELGLVEPFMQENKYTFPVILGQAYAESQDVHSIPRNWIVSVDGKLMFEGTGFGGDGQDWIKKALAAIQKVKGTQ
jgi:thiol-disulfide isomerase/thioredoxin